MAIYMPLDCETAADPTALAALDPIKVPGNYKKDESIATYVAEAEAERAARLALDPNCNRIIALCYVVVGHGDPVCHLMRDEDEERQHLIDFRDRYLDLDRRNDVRTITYSGFRFDLPTLMRRALFLDIPNFPQFNLDRYRSHHVDVWQRLSYNGTILAHSLAFYAKRLNLGTLDKVDGSEIAQLLADGNWAAISAHCLSDVGLVHALAHRLMPEIPL